MPGDGTTLTWIDVYMSVVGLLMVFAVIENIYAQYVNEHHSEKCAVLVDRISRIVFPASFAVMLVVLLIFREDVTALNIFSHVFLAVFAMSFVGLAIWDTISYIPRMMKSEAKQTYQLKKAQDEGEPLPIHLDLTARDLQSMFNKLDKDRSGFVNMEEGMPLVYVYFPVPSDKREQVEAMVKEAVGAHHIHGMQVAGFKDMLTKTIDIIVNKMDTPQTPPQEREEKL